MKESIFIFLCFCCFCPVFSQVGLGINTKEPKGIFHIDSKGDTHDTENITENAGDDIIVDGNGNLGIGTIAPTARVHIKTEGTSQNPVSGFALQDGSQGEDKILTVDAGGVASWIEHTPRAGILGVKGSSYAQFTLNSSRTRMYNMGSYIDLPFGRWMVFVVIFMNRSTGTNNPNTHFQLTCTFSETSNPAASALIANLKSNDIEGPYMVKGNGLTPSSNVYGGTLFGSLIINNTTENIKRYHLLIGMPATFGNTSTQTMRINGNAAENAIMAIRFPKK